jgi:acetolactate synthase I/II/III large subunit
LPTHADVVARALADNGVEYVFGLPGGEITAFIDACRRAGIRFVLAAHETSAAMMAQVMGEMTGRPGVCAATLGPGAANLVSGVANALLDRAPLLAFTAQMPAADLSTRTHQRIDLNALFRPVTKRSVTIGGGDTASLMQECAALALKPRPGPVHIALPSDVANAEAAATASPSTLTEDRETRRSEAIENIAARIRDCQRPLVLLGLGATPALAAAIRTFVNRLGAPFLVTGKAKGIVSEDHPLFLGVASGLAIDRDIVETIRTADLVIGIGFDPVECDKTWFKTLDIVALDSAFMDEGDYRPMQCVGDIAVLLAQLDSMLPERRPWPADLLAARRNAILRTPGNGDGLSPLAVLAALRSIFPRDGIVTTDVGAHKFVAGQFWTAYEPGTFLMSNGLSSMGFGVPAAIGAQLARPQRRVMAIVGDGGMLMTAHDLALIRELDLPIILVCLVDRSLSLIRVSQQRRGLPTYGVDFVPPDFAALAAAFGIRSETPKTIEEVQDVLGRALEESRPVFLQVEIDIHEYYELV